MTEEPAVYEEAEDKSAGKEEQVKTEKKDESPVSEPKQEDNAEEPEQETKGGFFSSRISLIDHQRTPFFPSSPFDVERVEATE